MKRKVISKSRVTQCKAIPVSSENAKLSMERGLAQVFLTFTQAAGSLEKSYTSLQSEVVRLREELRRANAELEHSLEENARMRGYLAQVLENLPCGVVVAGGSDNRVQLLNPQARRLLQIPQEWKEGAAEVRPDWLEKLLALEHGQREAEWLDETQRTIGVSCARLSSNVSSESDRIWIVRDNTEQKRAALERERAQQALALAEITTLLAHEIRNPLGSMELFTGLLEESVANTPETRQWVNHLRAGLPSLSATLTNVVNVYITYLGRKK